MPCPEPSPGKSRTLRSPGGLCTPSMLPRPKDSKHVTHNRGHEVDTVSIVRCLGFTVRFALLCFACSLSCSSCECTEEESLVREKCPRSTGQMLLCASEKFAGLRPLGTFDKPLVGHALSNISPEKGRKLEGTKVVARKTWKLGRLWIDGRLPRLS